jgi:hypothetical protein
MSEEVSPSRLKERHTRLPVCTVDSESYRAQLPHSDQSLIYSFDDKDEVVSLISRQSIDTLSEYPFTRRRESLLIIRKRVQRPGREGRMVDDPKDEGGAGCAVIHSTSGHSPHRLSCITHSRANLYNIYLHVVIYAFPYISIPSRWTLGLGCRSSRQSLPASSRV